MGTPATGEAVAGTVARVDSGPAVASAVGGAGVLIGCGAGAAVVHARPIVATAIVTQMAGTANLAPKAHLVHPVRAPAKCWFIL